MFCTSALSGHLTTVTLFASHTRTVRSLSAITTGALWHPRGSLEIVNAPAQSPGSRSGASDHLFAAPSMCFCSGAMAHLCHFLPLQSVCPNVITMAFVITPKLHPETFTRRDIYRMSYFKGCNYFHLHSLTLPERFESPLSHLRTNYKPLIIQI